MLLPDLLELSKEHTFIGKYGCEEYYWKLKECFDKKGESNMRECEVNCLPSTVDLV